MKPDEENSEEAKAAKYAELAKTMEEDLKSLEEEHGALAAQQQALEDEVEETIAAMPSPLKVRDYNFVRLPSAEGQDFLLCG